MPREKFLESDIRPAISGSHMEVGGQQGSTGVNKDDPFHLGYANCLGLDCAKASSVRDSTHRQA